MERKNLYDQATFDGILQRIEALAPDSSPKWGKMTSAQMLAHCAEIAEVGMGKELKNTPFFVRLMAPLIKRGVMSDKPYRHDSPTHPQYVVADPVDFATQKGRMLKALGDFTAGGPKEHTHSLFGKMSAEDSGWVAYKHMDHHLSQFGV